MLGFHVDEAHRGVDDVSRRRLPGELAEELPLVVRPERGKEASCHTRVAEMVEHSQLALDQLSGEIVEEAVAHERAAKLALHLATAPDLRADLRGSDVGAVDAIRLAVHAKQAGSRVRPRLRHRPNETTLEVAILRAGGESGDLELLEPARVERYERAAHSWVVERDAVDDVAVRLLSGATPYLIGARSWRERNDRREVVAEGKGRQLGLVDPRAEARVLRIDRIRCCPDDDRFQSGGRVSHHDVDLDRCARRDRDALLRRGAKAEPAGDQGVVARRE